MKASNYTKKAWKVLWLLRLADFVFLFVPVIVYIVIALASGGVTVAGRVSVVASVMVSIILTSFNVITKRNLRSPRWIVLIGLYVAVREQLLPLVIMLAVTSVLDDIVFTPLIDHYKHVVETSLVIDRRMGDNLREEI